MAEEEPLPSPPLLQDKWVTIQKNTFTNFVNQQLRETEHQIEELYTELSDGVKLCALVAALQGKPGIRGMKPNPKNRHQMIENVTLALQAAKHDKLKIVNIGAEDIVNGNGKLILGLIWSYILRYQLGKTEIPPKQLMLAWINAVIPECNITNFTTNWNNGRALHALIDYCEPGLSPNWRKMSTSDKQGNCETAMRLAQERLGVPIVVSPQHMASSDLDQNSGMTYLSYFMKLNSCGYKATLRDVNQLLPSSHVTNFTSDWRDGTALTDLVQAVGGHIPNQSPSTGVIESTQLAIQGARDLGIEPILSAEDMVQPQAGHLAVMAYAARFINRPAMKLSAASYIEVLFNTVDISPGSKTHYSLLMKQGNPRLHSINVKVADPNGNNVPTTVEWDDQPEATGLGTFIPTVVGEHQLKVTCDGEMIRGSPIKFNVGRSKKAISFVRREQGIVGDNTKLEVLSEDGNVADVHMTYTSPSGLSKEIALSRSSSGRSLSHSFVPDVVGEWKVSVLQNGEHASGSPYTMNVIKPQAVKLCNLEGGLIGQPFSFTVDTSEAGKAELQCLITFSGQAVPSTIERTGEDTYHVKFTPSGPGTHLIRPMYGGKDVRAEPYKVEITDSNLVLTDGPGLKQAKINESTTFWVDASQAGPGQLNVHIKDAGGVPVPSTLRELQDKRFEVKYSPAVIGPHSIDVEFDGKRIKHSPFTVNVYKDPKAEVPREGVVNQPLVILLDTANTEKGDLSITINEGRVPVTTKKLSKSSYSAEFIPSDLGQYKVELEFNNSPIQGSPWYVNITAPVVKTGPPVLTPTPPPVLVEPPTPPPVVVEAPPPLPVQPAPAPSTDIYAVVKPKSVRASAAKPDAVPTQYARVGETRSFDIIGKENVTVKIIDVFGSNVPFTSTPTPKGFAVNYKFKYIGDNWIHLIGENGRPLKGSPFLVCAFDPGLVVVSDLQRQGVINTPSHFKVNTLKAGRGEVTVLVDKGATNCEVYSQSKGDYSVTYTSISNGVRNIDVLFNNLPVPGSPFQTDFGSPPVPVTLQRPETSANYITPAISPISVTGSGLHIAEESKRASFLINPFGQAGQPSVRIEGPHSIAKTNIQPIDSAEGRRYEVTYVPVETGIYNTYVMWNGRDIEGSPYHPRVVDSKMVKLDGDWYSHVDEEGILSLQASQNKRLLFDVSRAGPGELKVTGRHLTSGSPLQCTVSEKDVYHYWVDIVASEPGDASIDVEWSGFPIPKSPIRAAVVASARATNGHVARPPQVVLSGFGLESAVVNKVAEFYIDGSQADKGSPGVILTNSRLQNLQTNMVAVGESEYRCSYTVPESGIYMLHVSWSGNDLQGSPFSVTALDGNSTVSSRTSDGPDKITVRGDGVLPGILATYNGTFYVDTEDAGKGDCEVKVQGPKGDVQIVSSLQGNRKRLLQCQYNPTEIGLYVIRIRWSGQDVAGSPIRVHIFDTYEELERFNNTGEISMYMPVEDAPFQSSIFPQPAVNGKKSKSVPHNRGVRMSAAMSRSYTAGAKANQLSFTPHRGYDRKSYYIVKENGPEFISAPAQRSVFIADK